MKKLLWLVSLLTLQRRCTHVAGDKYFFWSSIFLSSDGYKTIMLYPLVLIYPLGKFLTLVRPVMDKL
jgi:hypothetical protein